MEAVLEATARETIGKNEARRTRRGGQVPAVLYGSAGGDGNKDPRPIAVDPKALLKILHSESGANTLISLKLAGEGNSRVLVKDYQLDPITHHVLHADFYRVAMDRALQVTIPVVVKGEPKGVKQQGGLLEFIRREIEIECLPADIPEHVEVDVSDLMLHQGLRVRDIATDARWKPRQRSRHDDRPRDRAEGRRSRARPTRRRRCWRRSPSSSRRARRTSDEKDDKKKDDKKK